MNPAVQKLIGKRSIPVHFTGRFPLGHHISEQLRKTQKTALRAVALIDQAEQVGDLLMQVQPAFDRVAAGIYLDDVAVFLKTYHRYLLSR